MYAHYKFTTCMLAFYSILPNSKQDFNIVLTNAAV